MQIETLAVFVAAIVLLFFAAVSDLSSRRIPNWVNVVNPGDKMDHRNGWIIWS